MGVNEGTPMLEVVHRSDREFYVRTRAFYLAMGFSPLFESEALFGPDNPAIVLVKALPGKTG